MGKRREEKRREETKRKEKRRNALITRLVLTTDDLQIC